MNKKILIATGSDYICKYLSEKQYEVIPDIPYQDGVLEIMKRELADVLILSSKLPGQYDKYMFIERIRSIDTKIKIIVIIDECDDNYKSFLYTKGIFDIFIDGKSSMEELLATINNDSYIAPEFDLRPKSPIDSKQYIKNNEISFKGNLALKFQKQQIITFVGAGSSGKTTLATQFAQILAKKTRAKILLIDLDIVNAGLNRFMGVSKEPDSPEYILPADKNSSLNYMIEAIDKRKFNSNTFEKYVLKQKHIPNLDILTGNKSLYICKNILSSEYYLRILESAKAIYDYIIIDTSGNIFLDSMQFALLNSTKAFVVAEGNYVSLERTCRLLLELFPVWGVVDKKIEIIINKYNSKSLDKTIIKELLKGYSIAGYIKFSDKYEEMINSTKEKIIDELAEEYNAILESLNIFENYKFTSNNLSKKILGIKTKLCRTLFHRMEGIC